ncbi:MAG: helix-turn-helix transcriptional regulator [Bacilli bacterium]|nr:helix-turn-helix transcriptional regulator [Bacilli bacterium]
MAIRAYSETYLAEAQAHLGVYFDLAKNWLGDVDRAASSFLESGIAARFEKGDPFLISGMSGAEMSARIFFLSGRTGMFIEESRDALSPEYWLGYVLAYYQWYSNRSFQEILEKVPASKMISFYNPYHEMDILSFCEKMDRYFEKQGEKLKKARIGFGLSQRDLALLSEVPLRSIQQYEQGNKLLVKASYETVFRLSRALGKEPSEII